MSKVLQLRAAIAPRGFVLPTHLNLMSSDAGNHARSAGLIIVFTDPDDAVTNTSLRATAVFMTMPPIDLPMKEDRRAVARERHGLPLWRLRNGQGDAHQSKIFGSGIPIIPPGPEYLEA